MLPVQAATNRQQDIQKNPQGVASSNFHDIHLCAMFIPWFRPLGAPSSPTVLKNRAYICRNVPVEHNTNIPAT